MIKTTAQHLLAIKATLQQIANTPMPVKDCISIVRLLKAANKEYDMIETVQKKSLDKWAKKDEKGQFVTEGENVVIEPDHVKDYNSDINELLNTELTIEAEKINYDMLKNVSLTPGLLLALEDFLEE